MGTNNVSCLTLLSPAKVNLFFRVLRKRSDGYHEIASLYQAINLFDTLRVSLSGSDQLTCTDPVIPTDASNLLYKALSTFRRHTGWSGGVRMHLEKKIPIQSGLGGGSGNAATLLWALKTLLEPEIPDSVLAEWAAEFSSDASFFFSGGTAYCTGRGEKFDNLAPLTPQQLLIVKPPYGLSTPAVYGQCNPELLQVRDPLSYLQKALSGQMELFNDLEPSAFAFEPSLALLKEDLIRRGMKSVCMTGSGSAMMCLPPDSGYGELGGELTCYPTCFINRTEGLWYH
ncbi:MAG: 4-(cytidine 5'-diphospho)-2-C-methyl-D-erythritol kinase [Chlamydiota bacterium]